MAESNNLPGANIYSANDPLDINELASLNEDITPEFIEQLQNKLTQNNSGMGSLNTAEAGDDSELFEEVQEPKDEAQQVPQEEPNENLKKIPDTPPPKISLDENIDDNFIKKYKAKLNKQQNQETSNTDDSSSKAPEPKINIPEMEAPLPDKEISTLTSGNIIEKPIAKEQLEYNDSLDFLDENVKYSKYVIYINPENTEFIESLTVKERKNLINKILREQDDIAITKKRLGLIQTVIKHSIVAIITIAISIPVVYWTLNASLEATINNHRRSQSIFKTLYREKGKIKTKVPININ